MMLLSSTSIYFVDIWPSFYVFSGKQNLSAVLILGEEGLSGNMNSSTNTVSWARSSSCGVRFQCALKKKKHVFLDHIHSNICKWIHNSWQLKSYDDELPGFASYSNVICKFNHRKIAGNYWEGITYSINLPSHYFCFSWSVTIVLMY